MAFKCLILTSILKIRTRFLEEQSRYGRKLDLRACGSKEDDAITYLGLKVDF